MDRRAAAVGTEAMVRRRRVWGRCVRGERDGHAVQHGRGKVSREMGSQLHTQQQQLRRRIQQTRLFAVELAKAEGSKRREVQQRRH